MAVRNISAERPKAPSSGRRVGPRASATTRFLCRTAMRRPSARWMPNASTAGNLGNRMHSLIARGRSRNSPAPAWGRNELFQPGSLAQGVIHARLPAVTARLEALYHVPVESKRDLLLWIVDPRATG